jgi:hypothetical protein
MGQPDLSGVWSNATITRPERDPKYGDRLILTPDEAKAIEGASDQRNARLRANTDTTIKTGVSIGEGQKLLRDWLGHEARISGQVYRTGGAGASGTPGVLSATVRIGDAATARAVGTDSDIDALVAKLGEGVFAATQPYRYSVYLEHHDRRDEALAVLTKLTTTGDRTERAWANIGVGSVLADPYQSQVYMRRAEAQAQWKAAAGLDLSAADRAELTKLTQS